MSQDRPDAGRVEVAAPDSDLFDLEQRVLPRRWSSSACSRSILHGGDTVLQWLSGRAHPGCGFGLAAKNLSAVNGVTGVCRCGCQRGGLGPAVCTVVNGVFFVVVFSTDHGIHPASWRSMLAEEWIRCLGPGSGRSSVVPLDLDTPLRFSARRYTVIGGIRLSTTTVEMDDTFTDLGNERNGRSCSGLMRWFLFVPNSGRHLPLGRCKWISINVGPSDFASDPDTLGLDRGSRSAVPSYGVLLGVPIDTGFDFAFAV